MAASKDISHGGKIIEITPEVTTVEIISESACASCHASALCGMSDSKRKIVQVPTTMLGLEVGQEVDVLLKPSMGHKAVWVAYVIPLFVLLGVLLILQAAGASEVAAGLGGIGAVAVYYFCIWLFRNQLRKNYSFHIRKK